MSSEIGRSPRGYLGLMFARNFGLLFWGKITSSAGVWTHGLVAAVVVFDATGSALAVSFVSAVQFGPQLLFAPISGALTDRGHAVFQIVSGRLLCLLGSASLALWFVVPVTPQSPDTQVAAVLSTSLVVGLGFVMGGPALNSVIPTVVTLDELSRAMTLNSLPMTTGRIVGPVFGAFVLVHYGPGLAFAVAAGGHALFLAMLAFLRLPRPTLLPAGSDLRVRTALRYVVLEDRPLLYLLMAIAVAAVATEPTISLTPAIVHVIGGGPGLIGALTATFGVGAVLGFAVMGVGSRFLGEEVLNTVGFGFIGLGLLLAMIPAVVAVAGGFVAIGTGFSVVLTCASTLIQARSPAYLRGRVMGFWMMAFVGARPLAAVIQGAMADLGSVQVALVATLAVVLWSGYLTRPSRIGVPTPAKWDPTASDR